MNCLRKSRQKQIYNAPLTAMSQRQQGSLFEDTNKIVPRKLEYRNRGEDNSDAVSNGHIPFKLYIYNHFKCNWQQLRITKCITVIFKELNLSLECHSYLLIKWVYQCQCASLRGLSHTNLVIKTCMSVAKCVLARLDQSLQRLLSKEYWSCQSL